MITERISRQGPHRLSAMVPVAGVLTAVAVGALIVQGKWVTYALLLTLFLLLPAIAGLSFESLLLLLFWMMSLVHLLKRAIFLVGAQPQWAYYSVLLLPTAILLLLLLVGAKQIRSVPWPRSGRVLLLFGCGATLSTLISLPVVPFVTRMVAVHDRVVPLMMYWIGLVLSVSSPLFLRTCGAFVGSAALSVLYALLQLAGGPTLLDRVWAEATAEYSVQGLKTLRYLQGLTQEWRVYSFYADPMTWGLFLVAAFAAAFMAPRAEGNRSKKLALTICLFVVGLFISLTRTPWAGFLVMIATYVALRFRSWQNARVLFASIVAGFFIILGISTYLYQQVFPFTTTPDNPLIERYTATGTLEVRLHAWDKLQRGAYEYWLLGAGFGYSDYYSGRLYYADNVNITGHNFIVELVVNTGLPGMLLFMAFLWFLFREGIQYIKASGKEEEIRRTRWLLAFVLGYVITGYLNGGNFMNPYFFFFAGVLGGQFAMMKQRQDNCNVAPGHAVSGVAASSAVREHTGASFPTAALRARGR